MRRAQSAWRSTRSPSDLTGAELTALATSGYNPEAGNLIVVWTVSYSGAKPIGSVQADSAGDTFTAATLNRGAWYGQWFYAKNVKGDSFLTSGDHPSGNYRKSCGITYIPA